MARYQATLSESEEHQEAVTFCLQRENVSIAQDGDDDERWIVYDLQQRPLGVLPPRSVLIDILAEGGEVASAIVLGVNDPKGKRHHHTVTIGVECFEPEEDDGEFVGRTYKLGIVGESNYQAEIRRCAVGQPVEILHEPNNPYDADALAVISAGGETIGYIPRSSWLREAVHEEGKGCRATIASIGTGESRAGALGVVLEVALAAGPIGRLEGKLAAATAKAAPAPARAAPTAPVRLAPPAPPEPAGGGGWLARLFGGRR